MKPSVWPDWLDDIWAKSAEKGEGHQPETLAQHTWLVLERLSDFIHLRPGLPAEIGQPRLWHILFWAAFLHDFGKAAGGFQDRLRGGAKWPHRHEVLSLAFVDWVAQGFSVEEQKWLVAAIVSHHKDAKLIINELYQPPDDLDDLEDDQLPPRVAELKPDTLVGLWRWLAECPESWLIALGLNGLGVELLPILPQAKAVAQVRDNGARRIYEWLDTYDCFIGQLKKSKISALITGTLTLRGYITNADHSASSHRGPLPTIALIADEVLQSRKLKRETLYNHQLEAETVDGSVLLTAPTGSGKTEAALLWAARQTANSPNQLRLFYTLPYQASMNAMKLRLDETFGKDDRGYELVGLQHGRAELAHYRMLLDKDDDDANPKNVIQQVKIAKNMAELNYPPVRVFSPYQMLKGPYRLKGYEKLLSDYHHALFIFDEIHAYEPRRLALIMETIKYLRLNFQSRFIVMSATFPKLIQEVLLDALSNVSEIKANDKLFEDSRFQRHQLRLRDGQLLDNLTEISTVAQSGKSVLVACNRVAVAQEAYQYLQDELGKERVDLLHGRFNMRDRSKLEQRIRDRAGANVVNPQPFVLVATQAVEVSLDIDLDTIFTEPAPLDALVQRFGRVNRRGKKGLADVFVFQECDWDKQKYVYDTPLVEATLKILNREKDQPINEKKIGDWLNEIYKDEIAEEWRRTYQQAAQEFTEAWLKQLCAFESVTSKTEQDFYRLFDGVEVLPGSLVVEYEAKKKEGNYLEAAELLVPMAFRQWQSIHAQRRNQTYFDGGWPWVVDLSYSSESGLDMSQRYDPPEHRIVMA